MEDVPPGVVRLLVGLEWVEPFSANDSKYRAGERLTASHGDYKLIYLMIRQADVFCEAGRRASSATLDLLRLT